MAESHPWTRYVAIGDSFTEGIGDPEPSVPGGHRGWADRVAEVLAQSTEDFAYANLAIRGRLLDQIASEQVEPALELRPDLITISAGGNDMIRPGADPDAIANRLESAVARLRSAGATVVLFTATDVGFSPVFRTIRGKVAIYNENLRAIAAKHDVVVADMWALTALQTPGMWDDDRLHLAPLGHHTVARMVLDTLAVDNDLEALSPEPLPGISWRQARGEDLVWAREYLVPWVLRRIRHQSSGDFVTAKRPVPEPYRREQD
jgi:lysophospholipase L1-like esterase